MILSYEKKLLFIHVPRTGGTSLRDFLLGNFDNDGGDFWQHTSLEYFQRESGINLGDYFKFALVRNPWDRFVSLFSLFSKYDATGEYRNFEEVLVRLTVDRQKTPRLYQQAVNQLELLEDRAGNVDLDFLGRFEDYRTDIDKALMHLGMAPPVLARLNAVGRPHYSTFYTAETREIIAEYCRPDIEYFDYAFETPESQYEDPAR